MATLLAEKMFSNYNNSSLVRQDR